MNARRPAVVFGALLAACAPRTKGSETPGAPPLPQAAMLSMLLAPDAALVGEPNVWQATITPSNGAASLRSGDLPSPGQTLTIAELPAAESATVSLGLFKDAFTKQAKTHTCQGEGPLRLVAGETATIGMDCLAVANAQEATPARVFIKVAAVTLAIAQADPQAVLDARDWKANAQFAQLDAEGRRLSLLQQSGSLTLHIGGELTYRMAADPKSPRSPLEQLLAGEALRLRLVAGRAMQGAPADATLRMTAAAALFEAENGRLAALLPLALGNDDATVGAAGHLVEEAPDSEFTIASYNVENLFDQVDESRNAVYGDYRITPNQSSQSSNYGQPVEFEGVTTTYTGVKIAGIRKALLGLAPQGPEVVGLVEIESQAALDALFEAVRDLGYLAAEFTTWAPGDKQNAVGCGLLSKFPVKAKTMLTVARGESDSEPGRPIVRVELDVHGHPLFVYVNHWKSKGGPESRRILYAQALRRDLDALLEERPAADYVVMGDLNSEYNERLVLQARHDDAGGTTGINDILKAQGDEWAVRAGTDLSLTYNLHYELDRAARRTAWHMGFDWSSLDHMIVGSGVYDQRGITYVDNSFQAAHAGMPDLAFLFNTDGTTKRWRHTRESDTYTRHEVGGYSDHAPIAARFLIQRHQSDAKIQLFKPGRPDQTDGT